MHISTRWSSRASTWALLGLPLLMPLPALALDAAANSSELEEITVTAEKRSESEQNVPLSMTNFSSAAIQTKAITTFFDYGTKVPNLAFAPTGDGVGTARTVSIRGVSGDNTTSFYIDDIPLPDSIDPRVLDIDHIEVLRGPQGTLYGARSMGGLVRLVTKEPNLNTLDGSVHAGVSATERTDRPNYVGDAVINVPLVEDKVAVRVSGFYDQEAGYFKRTYCTNPAAAVNLSCTPLAGTGITTVNNVAANNTYGGAVTLTIKPIDSLTITPRFMMQRSDYNGFPMADYLTVPGNGIGYPFPATFAPSPNRMVSNDFTQARWFNVPEGGYDYWYLASIGLHWKTGLGEFVSSTGYFSRKVDEWEDETDFIAAVVTTIPEPGVITEIKEYQRFVEEMRFASTLNGPVQFVAGAFYSDLHGSLPFTGYYPPATVTNLDNNIGGQFSAIPNLVFAQDFHTDVQEPAVFGEVSYQPIEPLKLTGGLRWYQVKQNSQGYEQGLATNSPVIIVSPYASTSESGVNPKFEADYHITPDQMVYTNIAKGFRPGGLVPIVPAGIGDSCETQLKSLGISLQSTRSYRSDTLWNYELGTKTSWFDHRLTVDAAGFFIKWNNIQQQILLDCGFQFRANAGAAEIKGGELEVHARPIQPLDISMGVGYQHAEITEASASSPQQVGSPVYQVPDWTANGAFSYTTQLSEDWNFVSGADYSYIGRTYSGNNDPKDPRLRPSYRLINSRFAFDHGGFEVAVVGKNLANEVANLGDNRSIAAEVPGRPRLFVNQPRTVGIEFRQAF